MPHTASASPGLRSQDLVFTLYGDYLLARDRPVWTGALITLLGQLGLTPMAVRTVLSRMTRKNWLTVERRGTRSWYGLTRKGRALLEAGRERIYHPPLGGIWDGQWSVVTFSIPEERRHLRDSLRARLAWLGFGSLSNGVWISPHDVRVEVRTIATELKIGKHLELFRGSHEGFSDASELVRQCWDLEELNRRYAAFIGRWQPDFDHCRHCGMSGARAGVHSPCTAPADCFRRRFMLVHEYRRFPMDDPYLPRPLLSEGWNGDAAARLFETYHEVLTEPAERYVAEVCRQGDVAADAA
jgi:phenylacetic acid degradation operon negative regulatory protein